MLVTVEPPVTLTKRLPMSNMLPVSLKNPPARFKCAGPGVPAVLAVELLVTFKKVLVDVNELVLD